MRTYFELAAVVLALILSWQAYITGRDHGRATCEADHANHAEVARMAADETNRTAAATNTSTQTWLWQALPPIDLRTTEARERVRIVYREIAAVPPADRCTAPARPVSVQAELDAARERVAAAAGSPVRPGSNAGSASGSELHGDPVVDVRRADGRLGALGDRADRSRGGEGPRLAHVRAGPP